MLFMMPNIVFSFMGIRLVIQDKYQKSPELITHNGYDTLTDHFIYKPLELLVEGNI